MLGKLLAGNEQRDAIHVAIAPVENGTSECLRRGAPIKLIQGSTKKVRGCPFSKSDGIVDPFLQKEVGLRDKFYMVLHPNTVTGMRHEWTHPAFDSQPEWLISMADTIGVTVDELIEMADKHLETGELICMGFNEGYSDIYSSQWMKFWNYYASIRGTPSDRTGSFFRCAC